MTKAIYFDMDGTVANLYDVPNWLEKLQAQDATPYTEAKPLVDMEELKTVCNILANQGYTIGVITWLSNNSTPEYDKKVIYAKQNWLKQNMPYVTQYHPIPYGMPKQKAVKKSNLMILVDDNENVRKLWNTPKQRISIDANKNIIEELYKLVEV